MAVVHAIMLVYVVLLLVARIRGLASSSRWMTTLQKLHRREDVS